MAAEDTILAALSEPSDGNPKWFLEAKHATGYEDLHKETDIVVRTSYGDVRIDVKSSDRYAQRTYKGENVILVVLHPRFGDRQSIRKFVLERVRIHLLNTSCTFRFFEGGGP